MLSAKKTNLRGKVFETVLSSPGISEKCKIGISVSRQTIVLLALITEAGLDSRNKPMIEELTGLLPAASLEEVRLVIKELLEKGGLVEFYNRLKQL